VPGRYHSANAAIVDAINNRWEALRDCPCRDVQHTAVVCSGDVTYVSANELLGPQASQ
jgi:hypothetical protein